MEAVYKQNKSWSNYTMEGHFGPPVLHRSNLLASAPTNCPWVFEDAHSVVKPKSYIDLRSKSY